MCAGASTLALLPCARPAQAESLTQAVVQALNQHPAVIAALANRDALAHERQEYVSDYFPELNVSASTGRMYADNSTSRGLSVTRGAGYSWVNEGSISLRQMIFDGFETMNRVEAAGARKDSANLDVIDVRESLAMRAVAVYLDVLRNQETLIRLRTQQSKLDDYIKRIATLVDEGIVDESMVAQARDVRAQLQSTEAAVEGSLAVAKADYREVIGREPEGDMVRAGARNDILPTDVEKAVQAALQTHPSLRAADLSAIAYERDAEAEEGVLYPDVSGELSYLKRDQRDLIGGESLDTRAMLRVNWTLQTGGEQFSRIKKTKSRQSESRARREERERQIERSVRAAYADIDSAAQQVSVLKDRVRLGQDLMRTQTTQFEGARITLLQLMQTDNALFNSEMTLLNGEYRYLAAQYAALAGMGKLQESFNIAPVAAPVHE